MRAKRAKYFLVINFITWCEHSWKKEGSFVFIFKIIAILSYFHTFWQKFYPLQFFVTYSTYCWIRLCATAGKIFFKFRIRCSVFAPIIQCEKQCNSLRQEGLQISQGAEPLIPSPLRYDAATSYQKCFISLKIVANRRNDRNKDRHKHISIINYTYPSKQFFDAYLLLLSRPYKLNWKQFQLFCRHKTKKT